MHYSVADSERDSVVGTGLITPTTKQPNSPLSPGAPHKGERDKDRKKKKKSRRSISLATAITVVDAGIGSATDASPVAEAATSAVADRNGELEALRARLSAAEALVVIRASVSGRMAGRVSLP